MKNLITISSLRMIFATVVLSFFIIGCGEDDTENEGNKLPDVNIVQNNTTVNVGAKVDLNSTAIDMDGDALTYEWKFVSKPTGSLATLTTTTTQKVSFTADKVGEYVVQFVAKDVVDAIGKDTVTITAKEIGAFSNTCTSYIAISSTTYTTDTTLDGCYKVDRYIEIAENKLLTINPGSVLMFTSSGYIEVKGALKAVGTPAQPILFTGSTKSAGNWQGIQFENAVDDKNELANVIIEYGGSWGQGSLYANENTHLKIRDSIIRDSSTNGFNFGADVLLNEFTNVTSTNNAETAGIVGINALNTIDGTSDFTGNNNDYITLTSGIVNTNQIWSALTVPVLVDRYIEIASNKLLTIKPGARFEFVSSGYIEINGALKAIGTPEIIDKTTGDITPAKLITFTGATTSAGFWQGIQFKNAVDTKNELVHVVIKHAGSWGNGALYASDSTNLKIRDSIISDSSTHGFNLGNDVVLNEFRNVTSTNNAETAGIIGPKALSAIDNTSDFTGNIGNDYLTVNSGTVATDETWNELTVPIFVNRYIEIGENALVTVNPGAIFKFASSGYLEVKGAIKAIGITTKPITFTGATASAGFWQSIQFRNAVDTRNELANVIIEYAGSWGNSNLYVGDATVLNVHDSIIRNSSGFGMWISNTATVINTNNSFSDNKEGSLHQD